MAEDSSLSIAANIIGILTFVFAVAAAIYARWLWLKSRIVPSQNLELLMQLRLNVWETAVLADRLEFSPSAQLQEMFGDVYQCQIDCVRLAQNYLANTTIERITTNESSTLAQIIKGMEPRMSILRNWCLQEQLSAGIAQLRHERRLQGAISPCGQPSMEEENVHAQSDCTAEKAAAKEILSKQWHWARETIRQSLSGAQLVENICEMHKQEDLRVIVERLIKNNVYEFTRGLGRLV